MARPSQINNILQAALDCFAERGYEGTRISHIADKAGVTEGALYRHFKSKEELAQAIYQQHMGEFVAQLQQIAESSRPVQERMRDFVRLTLATYRANPSAVTFVLLRLPDYTIRQPANLPFPIEVVERVVAQGQHEGLIEAGQPNLIAAIFLGCFLRPIIVAHFAAHGALDLIHDTAMDAIIEDAAWRSIATVK